MNEQAEVMSQYISSQSNSELMSGHSHHDSGNEGLMASTSAMKIYNLSLILLNTKIYYIQGVVGAQPDRQP